MVQRKVRIVIDTNWYISASINRNSRDTLYQILKNNRFSIFYCNELIAEYKNVISRPYFTSKISKEQWQKFIDLILPRLSKIKIHSTFLKSRDKKDNYLLSLAKDCDANFLITGDTDLLVLNQIEKTKIITMTDFVYQVLNK